MFIDKVLADNQRFRYQLKRDSIVESLYQPTQIQFQVSLYVDTSSHVELPGEQLGVDAFIDDFHTWRTPSEPYCVNCHSYTLENPEDEWCRTCHPIHGSIKEDLPKAEGPYSPKINHNICDPDRVRNGVVDLYTEGQPNLFKFK